MATPNPSRRTTRRISRAQSITPDSPFTAPAPTPPPPTRRDRRVRAASTASDTSPFPDPLSQTAKVDVKATSKLPAAYFLAAASPCPFSGTLEASLDAVLAFSSLYSGISGVSSIVTTLLQEPSTSTTNWSGLLCSLRARAPDFARHISTELFFLATRTLLPEQIAENRSALARLYEAKKQLAIRLVLRYDMLLAWKMEQASSHRDIAVVVASLPRPASPAAIRQIPAPPPEPAEETQLHQSPTTDPTSPLVPLFKFPHRRPHLPNILPTLIAAPPSGFTTHAVRERMKHHVTELDAYLLVRDADAEQWSDGLLILKLCFVLLQWQWLRRNNGVLATMETRGWIDLEGRADECEWIADDVRRPGAGARGGMEG